MATSEGLALTEAGLRRIIKANAPGAFGLKDFDDDLNLYGAYLARKGVVRKVRFAKKARKSSKKWNYEPSRPTAVEKPRILRIVEKEVHDLLCTESRKYKTVRVAMRTKGRYAQSLLVASVASLATASLGISLGLAMAIVSVCLLPASSVGVNSYCSYYEARHRLPTPKKTPKKQKKR